MMSNKEQQKDLYLYTDYPFLSLGDESGKEAPIRMVKFLSYEGDKYCEVLYDDIVLTIKRGYLYLEPGRCIQVSCVGHEFLEDWQNKQFRRIDMSKVDTRSDGTLVTDGDALVAHATRRMKQVAVEDIVTDRELKYEEALRKIVAIEDELWGGDWDEIEKAREIARTVLQDMTDNWYGEDNE